MAKKYENFSVGENLSKENEGYSAWTNDLLRKLVAGKTVIKPGGSTGGHRLIENEVVKPKKGTLTLFPSAKLFHGVSLVKKKPRYSFIAWWKENKKER